MAERRRRYFTSEEDTVRQAPSERAVRRRGRRYFGEMPPEKPGWFEEKVLGPLKGISLRHIPEHFRKGEPLRKKFDPEGAGYDYESAEKFGVTADDRGHYPSRIPGSGLILKGRGHKTWDKTVEAEEALGFEIYKGDDGRYYSRKKSDPTLVPAPRTAEPASTGVPLEGRPEGLQLKAGEKPEFDPDVMKEPRPDKWQREIESAIGFFTFPYHAAKFTGEFWYNLARGMAGSYRHKKRFEELRKEGALTAEDLATGIKDWLIFSLMPEGEMKQQARMDIGARIEERGYVAESVYPLIVLGKARMVKGGITKFTKARGKLKYKPTEPVVAKAEETGARPLGKLAEAESKVKGKVVEPKEKPPAGLEEPGTGATIEVPDLKALPAPPELPLLAEGPQPAFTLGKGRLRRTTRKQAVEMEPGAREIRTPSSAKREALEARLRGIEEPTLPKKTTLREQLAKPGESGVLGERVGLFRKFIEGKGLKWKDVQKLSPRGKKYQQLASEFARKVAGEAAVIEKYQPKQRLKKLKAAVKEAAKQLPVEAVTFKQFIKQKGLSWEKIQKMNPDSKEYQALLKEHGEVNLHAGLPLNPLRWLNGIVRFMDDIIAPLVTEPIARKLRGVLQKDKPALNKINEFFVTLEAQNPELAQVLRKFHGEIAAGRLTVDEALTQFPIGKEPVTLFGRQFKPETVRTRVGQLLAPVSVRRGRAGRGKAVPLGRHLRATEIMELTPQEILEARPGLGDIKRATWLKDHVAKTVADAETRGIDLRPYKPEIPEAGITTAPSLREMSMPARMVSAELSKALYDVGLIDQGTLREFYGQHLKRMYEGIEQVASEKKLTALPKRGARKLRLKGLRMRGRSAVETEIKLWKKKLGKVEKELAKIKITSIKGIGKQNQRKLGLAGYETLEDLLNATPKELQEKVGGIGPVKAQSFIDQAMTFLWEKQPSLLKERRLARKMIEHAPERVDLPWEWQKEMGRYMTPEVPFMKGSYGTIYNVATARLLRDIGSAKNRGKFWHHEEGGRFTKQVPGTVEKGRRVYGELADKYVTPEVFNELKPLVEFPALGQQMLMAWMAPWKKFKVTGSMATQVRNLWFNVFLADMARVKWSDYVTAFKEYRKRGPIYREALKEGILESDWLGEEVANAFRMAEKFGGEEHLAIRMPKLIDAISDKMGFRQAQRVYQGVDQVHKLSVYAKNRNAGLGKEALRKETYRWSQNYREVPHIAKWLRTKAAVVQPFLSFQFEAARLVKNAAVHRPVTLAKWLSLPIILKSIAQKEAHLSDRQMKQLEETLPPWRTGAAMIPFRHNGKLYITDVGYIFPQLELYERLLAEPNIFGSPVLTTTIEALTGRDLRTGRPITKPGYNTLDDIGLWADRLYRLAMPGVAPEIPLTGIEGGYDWRRVRRAIRGEKDYYGSKYELPAALIQSTVGVPVTRIKPGQVRRKKRRSIGAQIKEKNLEKDRIQSEYDRGQISKDEMKRRKKNVDKEKKELKKERRQY